MPTEGPQWWQQMVAQQAEALGPSGHDAFANWPARSGPGRAYPNTPRFRGGWHAGENYQPGDVVEVDPQGVGLRPLVCLVAHQASAERSVTDGAFWEPYRGEDT